MKWRCALIQRRLPDYPDGDLSPFWKRQVASHLEVCPDCCEEAEALGEVMSLYRAHPLPDPEPAFWQDFQQELHLKLARVNQTPAPAPWRLRLPYYLLGAGATAMVLVLAVYLGPWSQSPAPLHLAKPRGETRVPVAALGERSNLVKQAMVATPAPPALTVAQPVTKAPAGKTETAVARAARPEPAPVEEPEFSLAAGRAGRKAAPGGEGLSSEDDDLDWDVDSVVADLSREQQQCLKMKLESEPRR